jgi:hypothetical protein
MDEATKLKQSISQQNAERMEELIKDFESEKEKIEEGLSTDEEIDKLVEESISKEDMENFNIPDLTEEDRAKLTEDQIKIYNIGKQLAAEKEDDPTTKVNININDYIQYLEQDTLDFIHSDNIQRKEAGIEIAKKELIYKAYDLFMDMEQERFNEEVANVSQKTYPQQISKHYFDANNKMYGYNEDTEEVSEYIIMPEDEGKPLTSDKKIETRMTYKDTLFLTKLIKVIDEFDNIHQLNKTCNNEVRYKRALENINTFIRYRLEPGKPKNNISCADYIPDYINHMIVDHKPEYQPYKQILGKAFIFMIYKMTMQMSISDYNDIFYIYMMNNNLYMLNYGGLKEISGARLQLFKSLYACIDKIYQKLQNA